MSFPLRSVVFCVADKPDEAVGVFRAFEAAVVRRARPWRSSRVERTPPLLLARKRDVGPHAATHAFLTAAALSP